MLTNLQWRVDCEERNILWGKPGRSMLALRLSQRTATRCLAARPLPALAAARPARALSSAITKASGADKSVSKETAPAVDKETLQAFTGAPAAMMETRIVKIYQQPNTVQNATQNQIPWRMQWEDDQTNRWTNPLMGWTSTNDPLSNTHMTLEFHTAEDAMRFCERNGWKYEVAQSKPNKEMNASPKKYSDNFKWKGGKHCANALCAAHRDHRTRAPRLGAPLSPLSLTRRVLSSLAVAAKGRTLPALYKPPPPPPPKQ